VYASSSVSAWYVTSWPVTTESSSATSCSVIVLGTGQVVRAPVARRTPDDALGPCQGGEHVHVVAQERVVQAGGAYVPLGVPVITGEHNM
jgi:hypothetical protein